jgi:Fe-Mn family superoxide dismutase
VIARARGRNAGLFNNAAQAWNHGFYWHSLSPNPNRPAGELLRWIETAFESLENLEKELAARGAGHFSNGWVWLARKQGSLSIEETHDGDTLADSDMLPLLTIDLWEHAYYLDHQNLRPSYLEQVIGRHLNWDFAAENLAGGTVWKYPVATFAQ